MYIGKNSHMFPLVFVYILLKLRHTVTCDLFQPVLTTPAIQGSDVWTLTVDLFVTCAHQALQAMARPVRGQSSDAPATLASRMSSVLILPQVTNVVTVHWDTEGMEGPAQI